MLAGTDRRRSPIAVARQGPGAQAASRSRSRGPGVAPSHFGGTQVADLAEGANGQLAGQWRPKPVPAGRARPPCIERRGEGPGARGRTVRRAGGSRYDADIGPLRQRPSPPVPALFGLRDCGARLACLPATTRIQICTGLALAAGCKGKVFLDALAPHTLRRTPLSAAPASQPRAGSVRQRPGARRPDRDSIACGTARRGPGGATSPEPGAAPGQRGPAGKAAEKGSASAWPSPAPSAGVHVRPSRPQRRAPRPESGAARPDRPLLPVSWDPGAASGIGRPTRLRGSAI